MELLNINCPLCKKDTTFENSTLSLPQVKDYYKIKRTSLPIKKIRNGEIEWCCLDCKEQENIIIANWKNQTTKGYLSAEWQAILYYKAKSINCKNCNKAFIFSAEEQQKWYEEYKIFTDVSPKQCLACRRNARFVKNINKELSPLLKETAINPSKEKLIRISELYLALGNKRKAGIYLAQLRTL